jgi:hypothetical protein
MKLPRWHRTGRMSYRDPLRDNASIQIVILSVILSLVTVTWLRLPASHRHTLPMHKMFKTETSYGVNVWLMHSVVILRHQGMN